MNEAAEWPEVWPHLEASYSRQKMGRVISYL